MNVFDTDIASDIIPQIYAGNSFGYTGSIQTFTVPAGVTSLYLVLSGAGGGGYTDGGGQGGFSTGYLTVTPGTIYYFLVGQGGGAGGTSGGGGFGGGGTSTTLSGGGGGGMTWFSTQNTFDTVNVLLVAGGGGGGGNSGGGGSGGGLIGGGGAAGLGASNSNGGGGGGGYIGGGINGIGGPGNGGTGYINTPTVIQGTTINGGGGTAGGGGGNGGNGGNGLIIIVLNAIIPIAPFVSDIELESESVNIAQAYNINAIDINLDTDSTPTITLSFPTIIDNEQLNEFVNIHIAEVQPSISFRTAYFPYGLLASPFIYSKTIANQSGLPVLAGDTSDILQFRIYNNYELYLDISTAYNLTVTTYDNIEHSAITPLVTQQWVSLQENGFGINSTTANMFTAYQDSPVFVGGDNNQKAFTVGADSTIGSNIPAGPDRNGCGFIEVNTYCSVPLGQSTQIYSAVITVIYDWAT